MTDKYADFELDVDGNRVLIGLTVNETLEFDLLTKYLDQTSPESHGSMAEWLRLKNRLRELWDQHQAAKEASKRVGKTQH